MKNAAASQNTKAKFKESLKKEGIVKSQPEAAKVDENRPDLFPDVRWIWDLFDILNRQRQVGANGPQPLSISDISSLLSLKGVENSDDVDMLLNVLPHLDGVYLKNHYDEVEKAMEKARSKAGAAGGKGTKRGR